jgi:hypothetical protein
LKARPEDSAPVLLLFDEACRVAEGTGYAPQALRERAQALKAKEEVTQAAITSALHETELPRGSDDFKDAFDRLEKARARAVLPAVREALDARREELRSALARVSEEVRAQAVQARRDGSELAVFRALERATRWGDPALFESLKKTLDGVPPPPSPEAGAYQRAWRAALDQAARGDLAGALSSLESAASPLTDPTTRREASEDLALFRAASEVRRDAVQAFGRLKKGQRISIESLDENAGRRTVEGTILRSGPGWIAVKSDTRPATVFVDGDDLTSLAVASLVPDRAKDAALLGILEGPSPDSSPSALSEKYVAWSRERGSPRPPPREGEARHLYHDAFDPEREWPDRRRKGSSAALYRRLLQEYSDTAFVAGRRNAIASRAEPAAETVFLPDDVRGHGGFRLVAPEKAPSYWQLGSAPLAGQARETYLEIEFETGSDLALKAWAYAGACCAESLSLSWQVTDLGGQGPNGAPVQMEPGSSYAMTVKAAVPRLPKAHAPTKLDPVNFGWVSLPMPKVSPSGMKKARILADQPGFAVKAIVVSSIRSSAPTDHEAREFEQIAPSTLLQGLVGWWKLDEGQGPSADSSRNGHEGTWVNGPTASPGGPAALRGGAAVLLLSGAGQYVEIANPGTFPSGRSPRSLCGWGKTRSTSPGFRWIAAFGFPTQDRAMFIGQNGTSLYGGGFGDDVKIDGFWDEEWHHIGLTYDGTTARLYADGLERASGAKAWELDPKFASIGRQVNYPNEFWNGWVDDVRIYDRVLSAAELKQMAEGR